MRTLYDRFLITASASYRRRPANISIASFKGQSCHSTQLAQGSAIWAKRVGFIGTAKRCAGHPGDRKTVVADIFQRNRTGAPQLTQRPNSKEEMRDIRARDPNLALCSKTPDVQSIRTRARLMKQRRRTQCFWEKRYGSTGFGSAGQFRDTLTDRPQRACQRICANKIPACA